MKINIPTKVEFQKKWKPIEEAARAAEDRARELATNQFLQHVGRALSRHIKRKDPTHYIRFCQISSRVSFNKAKDVLEGLGYTVHESFSDKKLTIYFHH